MQTGMRNGMKNEMKTGPHLLRRELVDETSNSSRGRKKRTAHGAQKSQEIILAGPAHRAKQPNSISALAVLHQPMSVSTPRRASLQAQRIKQSSLVPYHRSPYSTSTNGLRIKSGLSLCPLNLGELRAARRGRRKFLCGSSLTSTGHALRALATAAPYSTSVAPSLVSA